MPEHTPAPTPSRSVYGFVLLLGSRTLFLLFIVWGLIPKYVFEEINITYLPDRYWAVSVPVFLLTFLALFAFIIYPSLSLCMTPSVDDVKTILDNSNVERDECNLNCLRGNDNYEVLDNECICKSRECCMKKEFFAVNSHLSRYNIPMIEDLDIDDVCRKLYLK